MFIKSINNVEGYKNLPDGFSTEFSEDTTFIVGANFQGKTTIGGLFNWCLTGTNLYGKEKEAVANDTKKVSNVTVDISFVDNLGIEHRLVRNKGKEMHILLDGKEVKQEMLAQFYHEKDIFLVCHNPYYFASLEVKEQRDIFRKILPSISPEDAFNLLNEQEKEILKYPIEMNLATYVENRNEEKRELEKEYAENKGKIEVYKKIALEQVGDMQTFEKENLLQNLQERYSFLSDDIGESNVEDLNKHINKIKQKLEEIVKVDLAKIAKEYQKEKNNLQSLECEKSICPSCRQEIKDDQVKEHLKKFHKNRLGDFQKQADELKIEATELKEKQKEKEEILSKLCTEDMQQIVKEKHELEEQIAILLEEKNAILLHNREVQIQQEKIKNAKQQISILEDAQENIRQALEENKKKKEIANKLKRLVVEVQKEELSKYLDKVDIIFCRENKSNDGFTECCDIQYEGRDYKKISKSQQLRASLEISNLFNKLSGINVPIFLDDAESTTDIPETPNTQMIVSIVIKFNSTEVLYYYEDVLDRKKKSIEREIQENSKFITEFAA